MSVNSYCPNMEKLLVIKSFDSYEKKLYQVNKRTTLIITTSPKCLVPDGAKFRTNYPVGKNGKFDRSIYTDIEPLVDHQDLISSSFNLRLSLSLEISGTFRFVCCAPTKHLDIYPTGERELWSAYVIVRPELKVPIDSIRCQTVLSRNLGPMSTWRSRLNVVKDARYNMIHFTPIQELGQSNSSYSIRNQLKLNPVFDSTFNDIKKEVDYMEKKWSTLSITDIVLNHTADDSPWIRENPDCSFNMTNTPKLRPAFLLDSAFIWFMQDLISGNLKDTDNLTPLIADDNDIQTIGVLMKTFYVPQIKIHELFMINIGHALAHFDILERGTESLVVDYGIYERNEAKVIKIPERISTPGELEHLLETENTRVRNLVRAQLGQSIENALKGIKYERLNPSGSYYGQPVDSKRPIVAPYFTHTPIEEFRIAHEEEKMYDEEQGKLFMAHNGWVMGATSHSTGDIETSIYFKRELVAWGDCIKLRYGKKPEDSPFLWDLIRKYVESQAKIFHGFRIDNCHSTPLHVAEYVVDIARSVRPDIYIVAELFTQSEDHDNMYVNKLGLTCLIRESMNAHSCRELGRLIYRFGGTPVGEFFPQGADILRPGVASAIFYDQTHDNESPIKRRTVFDMPATTALINMANCATGSNRGYDELVPHYIDVVHEQRLYPDKVDDGVGLLPLRRFLNGTLLRELQTGFNEIFVDQVTEDIIAVTRHNPLDGRSIVLVARTAFKDLPNSIRDIRPISIEGRISRILIEAQAYGEPGRYERDENFINGLSNFNMKIFNSHGKPEDAKLVKIVEQDNKTQLQLNNFQFLPSSVIAIEVCLTDQQTEALKLLNKWEVNLDEYQFTLDDMNFLLFRCTQENSVEPYELPNFCKFSYSGLYGLMYYLDKVRDNQDQAHPLAVNLRRGNWLADYIVRRFKYRPSTMQLGDHLDTAMKHVYLLPKGMIPKYFDFIISKLYVALKEFVFSHMSHFVSKGPTLVKDLALSSISLVGSCESAPLPSIDSRTGAIPSIAAGLPHFSFGFMRNWGRDTFIALRGLLLITGRFTEAKNIILSYARTLKHGLIPNLIDAGHNSRYNSRDAVWWWLYCIREYTKMAPGGIEILRCKVRRIHRPEKKPQLNPNGSGSGLQKKRSVTSMTGVTSTNLDVSQYLFELIQEVMECHFRGMDFIEDNAGRQLDDHMTEQGFRVVYGTKQDTGFIFGGNRWNCGTWMDKMGSSIEAGNKGTPSSPRDGSAVELVALSKAIVSWLDELSTQGFYPYDKVERVYDNIITLEWTWERWASLIQANFDKYFYIPLEDEPLEVDDPKPSFINKRGIYKDTLGATIEWQDYQLRPNFLIACVVAPELFDTKHAQNALRITKEKLCGPIGMKTLDPDDWNYCGDYDNANQSTDPKVAHGFNYHQGPEWLWLTGYYVRASSKFLGSSERRHHLRILSNLYTTLKNSPWLGLPELTNTNGKECPFSCYNQAWSLSATIEALYESVRAN